MSRYGHVVDALLQTSGVHAALVVSQTDGIVVDGTVHIGTDADAVAALAARLYSRASAAAGAADGAVPGFFHLEADGGRLCVIPQGELLLVTVAEPFTNLGLLRLTMRKLADGLS
jgi:predicted regulator of Ras-like GTPase activity (Roadblock/LC7/MglB family)